MEYILNTEILYFSQNNSSNSSSDDIKVSNHLSAVDIILYILLPIQVILNIVGIFKIIKSTAKFKFELTVLVSGILECIFNFCFNNFGFTNFSVFVQFFQTGITLYIAENFLKLYYSLNTSKISIIYNFLFFFFIFLDFILCISVLFMDIKNFGNEYKIILELGNNVYGFICSLVLFIFGVKLNGILGKKLSSETKNKEEEENRKISISETSENNNYFIETRKRQLLITMFAKLLTATIEMISSIFRKISFYSNDIWFKVEEFSFWLETFSNFFAFFFVIRKGFHNKNETPSVNPILNDFLINNRNDSNAEIDKFLINSQN